MTERSIAIQTLTLGRRETPEKGHVFVSLMEEQLTVAELIRLTVEERIREVLARHMLKRLAVEGRDVLSPFAGREQRAREDVFFASKHMSQPTSEMEVEKAWRAFEAGLYLLLINKRRVKSLDEKITLTADAQVQFLRLTPLAGG
jgi:hypothetical protein